jgi:uncharacterized protein involved in exopolysaccharide biosynthesis
MEQSQIPAEQVAEINFFELLSVLVKRRKLIFCITAFVALLSVGGTLALKNVYTATAKILPPQKDGGGGISTLISQAGGLAALAAGAGLGGSSDLYVGILKSRSVADDVIKKLDLTPKLEEKNADLTRKKLAKKVKIQADNKSGIITISADDKDPQLSADLANSFVEELGRTTVKLNLSKVGIERIFLEKRLVIVKSDLKKAEDELKAFAQKNKVVQVDSQAKASIEGIAKLKAELAAREVQLSVLRTYQTDESPEVNALQAGIRKLHQEIDKLSGYEKDGEGIPSIGNVPGLGLEYARRVRDVKVQEAVFEQITKQYEVAKLNEAKDSSTIQVLDSAVVPVQKSKPARSLIILLATFSAFLCSVFMAFTIEYIEKLPEADREVLTSIKRQLMFSHKSTK